MTTYKKRIEYMDLAKGLCILLVVSYHIDMKDFFYANKQVFNFFFAFNIPLFYILSGTFLSIKEKGYTEFVQKKINQLLVPFIFFITITNIYYHVKHIYYNIHFQYTSPLYFLFTENISKLPNNPLWFLASLFSTYMIFAFMHYIFKGKTYIICIASLCLGFVGYILGLHKINIPFYLDTSLTCIPFLCTGMIIRKKTNILTYNGANSQLYNILFSLICFLIVHFLCRGENLFYTNEYDNNYFSVLIAGISGSLGLILLCKFFSKIPVISYIGRYSIIVLGTHTIIIQEMRYFFSYKFSKIIFWEMATFITIIIISYVLIHLFIKYIPYLVAQKDFIQFTFSKK